VITDCVANNNLNKHGVASLPYSNKALCTSCSFLLFVQHRFH